MINPAKLQKQQLLDRIAGKGTNKQDGFEWMTETYDILCSEYGWIPLEKYLKMPAQTVFNMLNVILKRKKLEAKAYKGKGKGKGLTPKKPKR